ncbi:rhamnose-proton symporter [Formosa agariphila KMM 3901]|uniref:Rhamnose-proton symporter n=1 Tax=Formosa agariphila (strain DSM 15362 / KCTC 12365 / LMG 23005 / KMM 3901 / M-2Alg 35-1) TaxID=1347342 RepID=T2KN41_FORAG|nr:L-rhamnose/proton symporter RhaT [Formosa agariphila]CDF79873.1 rhamnose-proton symporter [Formosa agariphila KMM 3901]
MGILLAIAGGIMLGFWAMPEKYIKNYAFENAWGLCYLFMLWVFPFIVAFSMIHDFSNVLTDVGAPVLLKMLIPGFLWGVGMMLWGKAINYIGMSLGFSIFIGTIIVVGSLLPWGLSGLPQIEGGGIHTGKIFTILFGITIILIGIIFNGRAGILRSAAEKTKDNSAEGNMLTGIIIAVVGGVLCTGFNVALEITHNGEVAKNIIGDTIVAHGNEPWLASVASMFIVYVSGGVFVVPYFMIMLSKKKLWGKFKVPEAGKNISLTSFMAALNFVASIVFAYSSFVLGSEGGSIGYAIFNTLSVVTAVSAGVLTKEWSGAPQKAKIALYLGLASMIIGVLVIAFL